MFPREDIDEWSFRAVKGQTIRCEVEAARFGSPLDSQLEIVDAAGRRLAVNSDHFGDDSLIVFTAPADGEYRVRIFDAAYGGLQPYVYRLTLSDRPHVLSTYPLGGRRGEKTTFELTGIGVESARNRKRWSFPQMRAATLRRDSRSAKNRRTKCCSKRATSRSFAKNRTRR